MGVAAVNEVRNDSGDAIRIRDRRGEGERTRWGMLLVVFMRVVAALWIVEGLTLWRLMLTTDGVLFDRVPAKIGVASIVFAVMDLVAAVGLWLATPWGGILWILVSVGQMAAAIAIPDFFEGGRLVVLLNAVLLGLYLFLTWRAAHEFDGAARAAPARRPWLRIRRRDDGPDQEKSS